MPKCSFNYICRRSKTNTLRFVLKIIQERGKARHKVLKTCNQHLTFSIRLVRIRSSSLLWEKAVSKSGSVKIFQVACNLKACSKFLDFGHKLHRFLPYNQISKCFHDYILTCFNTLCLTFTPSCDLALCLCVYLLKSCALLHLFSLQSSNSLNENMQSWILLYTGRPASLKIAHILILASSI
jgi:hypothetical protein